MSSTTQPYLSPGPPPAELRIVHWPLGDEPVLAGGLVAAGLAFGWYVGQATDQWMLGGAAVVALAVALWRVFVPSTYELTAKGLTPKVFGRGALLPWRLFQRYEIYAAGVLLSPYEEATALAGFRGIFVPFGPRRDELLAALRFYLGEPAGRSPWGGSSA